jgi:hypothetical protein
MTKLLMNPRFVAALGCIAVSLMWLIDLLKNNLQISYSQYPTTVLYLKYGMIACFSIYGLLILFKKTPVRSQFSTPVSIFALGRLIGMLFMMFGSYWLELARWEREKTETVMQVDQK